MFALVYLGYFSWSLVSHSDLKGPVCRTKADFFYVEKIQREHGAIPQDFIHIALALSNDSSSDVRAFVSGEITTVAAGSYVSSVFSRPPPLTH